MKVPQGWYVTSSGVLQPHHGPKHQDTANFLRLKKNFYGCKQAARNWFKLLSEGLHNLGFVQSATDLFLFLRSDCIIVVYVDDCLFFLSQSPLLMRSSTPYPKHLSLRTKVMFLHSSVSKYKKIQPYEPSHWHDLALLPKYYEILTSPPSVKQKAHHRSAFSMLTLMAPLA